MQTLFNMPLLLLLLSMLLPPAIDPGRKDDIQNLWHDCGLEKELAFSTFSLAVKGARSIDSLTDRDIITIIDFTRPSTEKRLFVIDLKNKKILFKCLVAHGRNSGDNKAEYFSNEEGSLKSCLGFFVTAETYNGKHGYSLRLDGVEKGINDNARARDIVIHGADYVSSQYIERYGRLGRSWGCPALPTELTKDIIDTIAGGKCLFIYADDEDYRELSAFDR